MDSIYTKIIVLILLFVGEALTISAEIMGAKNGHLAEQPIWQIFFKMLALFTLAGGFLIAGYILGFKAFKNIWIVSAASITSILIIEPILAWTIFHQLPTTGAVVGFVLGAIGLFSAILF
ncbi:MAG: hypothetical protein AAB766_04835 [Patescibacteria group bacterium]